MELTVQNLRPIRSNVLQVHLEPDARITMINSHLVLDAASASIQRWVQIFAMTVGLATYVLVMQLNPIQLT